MSKDNAENDKTVKESAPKHRPVPARLLTEDLNDRALIEAAKRMYFPYLDKIISRSLSISRA